MKNNAKEIILHDASDLRLHNWETEKCSTLGTIEVDSYDFGDLLEVEGIFFTSHTATQGRDHISVSKISVDFEAEDKNYENNITCPYCGYENKDSWEAGDEEDAEECCCCGGIFSYQRIVTVEYNSQPIIPPKAISGRWK